MAAEEDSRASSALAGSVAPYTPSPRNLDEHAEVSILRCVERSLQQVCQTETPEHENVGLLDSRPLTVGTIGGDSDIRFVDGSVSRILQVRQTDTPEQEDVGSLGSRPVTVGTIGGDSDIRLVEGSVSRILQAGMLSPSPNSGHSRPRPVRVPAKEAVRLRRPPLSARAETEQAKAVERRQLREARDGPQSVPEDSVVVLRCEGRAEEWHHDEALHASRVGEQKTLGRSHARREAKARDLAVEVTQKADGMVDMVCESATKEDLARASELSRLREELVEVRLASEQARDDCREYVASIERCVIADRQKRQGLEAELREERKQSEFARGRVDEIEEAELRQLRELDSGIAKRRAGTQAEIHRMQREADDSARALEEEMRQELTAVQQELDEAAREARGGVSSKLQQKRTVRAAAEIDVKAVDQQVRALLGQAHQQTLELQEDTFGKVQEIQARDFEHEAGLRQHMDALWAAVGCAEHETIMSAKLAHESKRRIVETTDALGAIYPRSTDFKLHSEKKIRSALAASGQYCVARSP